MGRRFQDGRFRCDSAVESAGSNRNRVVGERGTILVLSLWVVALLSLFSLSLVLRVRSAIRVEEWQETASEGREILTSLGELAVERLQADQDSEVDSYGEPWGIPLRMDNLEVGSAFEGAPPFRRPFVALILPSDECGKVNVNAAGFELLTEVLREAGGGADSEVIARAIGDWRDSDNLGEAESGYYGSLPHPYGASNEDFHRIEELLFVRGITPLLWFGEDANHNGRLDPEEDDGPLYPPLDNGDGQLQLGLSGLLTTQGDGTINVNTAPLPVLRCLLLSASVDLAEADRLAEALVARRRGGDGVDGTEDDKAFRELDEVAQILGEPISNQLAQLDVGVGLASTAFRMVLRVERPERHVVMESELLAVRDQAGLKVIEWQDDFS